VTTPRGRTSAGGSRRALRPGQVAALAVAALLLLFVVQNRDPVRIELFTIDVSAPLWIILVVVAALGVLVGHLLTRRRQR
jgi:uncharacterized integral membrane protein